MNRPTFNRNASKTPNAAKSAKKDVPMSATTATTVETATPAVDPDLLAAFKAQLSQMSPDDRKAVLKQVKIPRSKPAVVIPDGYTSNQAQNDYVRAVAAARKQEKKAREMRALSDAALEVWTAINPTVTVHRGKVVSVDDTEFVDG